MVYSLVCYAVFMGYVCSLITAAYIRLYAHMPACVYVFVFVCLFYVVNHEQLQ